MNENTNINNDAVKNTVIPVRENNEERSPFKKREIIKTILIVFLAGLLLLTFFSNTIMNRSLAEVTTDKVTSGKLTERVRGGGMVQSNQAYQVNADGNYTVDTINIKKGQEVKKDDVLFILKGTGETDTKTAEDTLNDLELEYEKALLDLPTDFTEKKNDVRDARLALDKAIAQRDAAYQAQFASAQEEAQLKSDKAESKKLANKKAKLIATINAIDSDDYTEAAPEYTGNLPSLLSRSKNADTAYQAAYDLYSNAVEGGMDEGVVTAALNDANAKEAVKAQAEADYQNEKSSIRYDLSVQLADTENAIDDITSRLPEDMDSEMGESLSYEACVANVQEKQNALDDAVAALAKAQNDDVVDSKKNGLDMEAKKKKIDSAKAELEKLKKKNGTVEVKSKYDGVVSDVYVQPDETTTPDQVMAAIDLVDAGFTVEVNVSAEKAKKLKRGVKAEIINNWDGSIEAVLSDIKNSSSRDSSDKVLIFDVTGDVTSGTSIELSIPCGSANYDTIVPKSALRSGTDGKYVLVVREKNSPLGNRYYAEKVKVDELASDEISCAVNAALDRDTYLITAASKSVDPGDQVRMKDK
ncbi:MAG: HlyD family efflux transporter periplasmic adaptor subunit [Ruminococcus sp.]|nr:HlyD family efflux transporter periplasmic adaptor subunit [Ruminococcus sp.]